MQEINLSSLKKDLCGFIVTSQTGVYYNNGQYLKLTPDGEMETMTPKAPGYYVPIPRSWINEAMLLEEGEDNSNIITNKELAEYDANRIYNFIKRSNNLMKMFQTIPNFMLERYHNFYGKGWLPLKTVAGTFLPENETGILVY